LGRMLTFDTLLCLFTVASLGAAHAAVTSGARLRRGWWLLSALACGLGLLTKGPVALALVAVPVLAFAALDARAVRPRPRAWAAWLAVALGLAAPWYALVARQNPDFLGDFFWRHHVERFLAPFDHPGPVWFYLPGLLAGMLPWT